MISNLGDSPAAIVQALVARFGGGRVILALLRALVIGRSDHPPPDAGDLADHLKRDIGLPPEQNRRQYWELR